MPRHSKVHEQVFPEQTLIVDNGASTMKAGFASSNPSLDDCHTVPNCLARERDRKVWVGSETEVVKDFGEMAFRRPIEKGYLVNWEAEKAIWDATFIDSKSKLQVGKPSLLR